MRINKKNIEMLYAYEDITNAPILTRLTTDPFYVFEDVLANEGRHKSENTLELIRNYKEALIKELNGDDIEYCEPEDFPFDTKILKYLDDPKVKTIYNKALKSINKNFSLFTISYEKYIKEYLKNNPEFDVNKYLEDKYYLDEPIVDILLQNTRQELSPNNKLLKSVHNNNYDNIQEIINSGADVNAFDGYFITKAIYKIDNRLLDILLKNGADIQKYKEDIDTVFEREINFIKKNKYVDSKTKDNIDLMIQQLNKYGYNISQDKTSSGNNKINYPQDKTKNIKNDIKNYIDHLNKNNFYNEEIEIEN